MQKVWSPSVYIKDTGTSKGRGVFSLRPFRIGEIVETCPVVVLHGSFAALPEEIKRLVFNWEVLANIPGTHALALGYGSTYNHDNPANMRYTADGTECALHLIAVRDIRADEELTINYNAIGGGPDWCDDNWFARMNIEPIGSL